MTLRVVVAGVSIVALAVACSSSPSPLPTDAPTDPPVSIATATPGPSATLSGLVRVDRKLLDVLPPTVGRVVVRPSPEGEADAASDPGLAALAEAFAAAIAVDPQSGDFVFAAVVLVRPGVLTDELFRDWRDSFDEGACSQAGGVVGNAEAEIDGRTVYIGSCEGGLLTYHAWLENRSLLVSASSVGEARLGEQLMEDLR